MSGSASGFPRVVRALVERHGALVMTDPNTFRGALEDFLGDSTDYSPGTINLLVDAVRHQVAVQVVELVDNGADPLTAIRTAGARFADVRGGGDPGPCGWAAAVLGYAAGRVPEAAVDAFRTASRPEPTLPVPPQRPPTPPVPGPPTSAQRSNAFIVGGTAVSLLLLVISIILAVWVLARG